MAHIKLTPFDSLRTEINLLRKGKSDKGYNEIANLIRTYYLEDHINSMEHDVLEKELKSM